MKNITYDDFKKLEMRIGWIRFVEPVEGTDKLLRCEIDFGEAKLDCAGACKPTDCTCEEGSVETKPACRQAGCECDYPEAAFGKDEYKGRDVRQIVSGIREYFPEYEKLVDKKALYIVNLEPREIRGVMSHGMLMAVDDLKSAPAFLVPEDPTVEPGSQVR